MGVRDYIRAEMGRSPSGIDHNVLASNVLLGIPRDELPVVLHELMVHAVRTMVVSSSSHLEMAAATARPAVVPAGAARCQGKPGRSKWEVGLPAWRALLNRTQLVDGKAYRLGDLTAGQLRQAARLRRAQASTMLDNAAHYEKIAAALDEHGVSRVDDLPDPVLETLFEAVAA